MVHLLGVKSVQRETLEFVECRVVGSARISGVWRRDIDKIGSDLGVLRLQSLERLSESVDNASVQTYIYRTF